MPTVIFNFVSKTTEMSRVYCKNGNIGKEANSTDRCQLIDNGSCVIAFQTSAAFFPRCIYVDTCKVRGVVKDIPASFLLPTSLRGLNRKLPFTASRDRLMFVGFAMSGRALWLCMMGPNGAGGFEMIRSASDDAINYADVSLAVSTCGRRVAETYQHFIYWHDKDEYGQWPKTTAMSLTQDPCFTGTIHAIAFSPNNSDHLAVITTSLWEPLNASLVMVDLATKRKLFSFGLPAPRLFRYETVLIHDDSQTFSVVKSDKSVWSGSLFPLNFDLKREYAIFAAVSRQFDKQALALCAAIGTLRTTDEVCFDTEYALKSFLISFFTPMVLRCQSCKCQTRDTQP